MPEQIPAPPPEVIVSLPETHLAAALWVLGRLIAKAAAAGITGAGRE
jgi:hypothetical protein